MYFSLIIPVFNRPDEITELLNSLCDQHFEAEYEILIIEDGSTVTCADVVRQFEGKLNMRYFFKPNSGPGDSRNFGMKHAKGDYFIIFDSDCMIPPNYLLEVSNELQTNYTDCYGGPDAALDSFSDIQKAINFAMTSFMTTGGIRGGSEKLDKFQPRSFNMGISRKAFEASGGFGQIHPGEDPDLSIRLWKMGFATRLISNAAVYHKRRISWSKFLIQVTKFGKARPILNKWHPGYGKLTYFFPTVFIIGFGFGLVLTLFGFPYILLCYLLYFAIALILATHANQNSLRIGFLAVLAIAIQFYGYGIGFLRSFLKIQLLNEDPKSAFPELFFKKL